MGVKVNLKVKSLMKMLTSKRMNGLMDSCPSLFMCSVLCQICMLLSLHMRIQHVITVF